MDKQNLYDVLNSILKQIMFLSPWDMLETLKISQKSNSQVFSWEFALYNNYTI